jgi:xanthine dehydrogenase accessory factor
MRDITSTLQQWIDSNERIALATVIWAEGSSPRSPGARLGVTASGQIVGSVSGGCVEGAVFEEAQEVLTSGRPQHLHYSVTNETAWEVGLACGGTVDIYVEPFAKIHEEIVKTLAAGEIVALATDIESGRHWAVWPDGHSMGEPSLSPRLLALFPPTPDKMSLSSERHVLFKPEGNVFLEVFALPPTIVIVGAVHVAMPLVQMAQAVGFRVQVVDARRTFLTRQRFPTADELVCAWPQEALSSESLSPQHYVVILSHDPKFDVPALHIALQSNAAYVGLIGSRTTQAERRQALLEAGLESEALERIHGPIGLDLGGRSPAEIALAILAEIVAAQHGRSGTMLSQSKSCQDRKIPRGVSQ